LGTALAVSSYDAQIRVFSARPDGAVLKLVNVLRHGGAAVVTATQPTMLAAVGFTFVGVIAALFPLQAAWLPLLAPLTVLGLYVLATRPFSDG